MGAKWFSIKLSGGIKICWKLVVKTVYVSGTFIGKSSLFKPYLHLMKHTRYWMLRLTVFDQCEIEVRCFIFHFISVWWYRVLRICRILHQLPVQGQELLLPIMPYFTPWHHMIQKVSLVLVRCTLKKPECGIFCGYNLKLGVELLTNWKQNKNKNPFTCLQQQFSNKSQNLMELHSQVVQMKIYGFYALCHI